MSFEQPNFKKEESEGRLEAESQAVDSIFDGLVALQEKYFQSESDEEKNMIEEEQRKLIAQGKSQAEKFLKVSQDSLLSERDRNYAMGRYGYIMDQLAVCLPWSEVMEYSDQYMRDEALKNLQPYFESHPKAKEVAKYIFYLFHHGAGIDKALTADSWDRELQGQLPDEEFAREYVKAEEKGKVYLEEYLALELDREKFSLEMDYRDLTDIGREGMKRAHPYVLDVVRWYARTAEYQKIAGGYGDLETNVRRAIELYGNLIEFDPSNESYGQVLNMIYQEQGIEKLK